MTNIPRFADKTLFQRSPTSFLEEKVKFFLQEEYPTYSFLRNHRKKFSDHYFELDFYCEALNLGFEVEDFGTHDRERDDAPGKWGPKKGPIYHRKKREAFETLSISVVELWEDAIMDESYEEQIGKAMENLLSEKFELLIK